MDKKIYNFIYYFRIIAAILIMNSHYDELYPVQALATGGAIGNALFFAVSGFCLYPIDNSFGKWITKKIVRIYVPTILMTAIATLTYYSFTPSIINVFNVFFWPTIFWFIGAIVLFYVLFYLLNRIRTNRQYIIFLIVLSIFYIGYYLSLDTSVWIIESNGLLSIEGCFKLIYYFTIMMIGKWFRIHCKDKFIKTKFYILQAIVAFFSLYGGKFLFSKITFLMHFQFLNQLSIIWMIIALFLAALSVEEKIKRHKAVVFMSKFTLEIYLVQFLVIHYMKGIVFPVNVILTTLLIIVLAWLLNGISSWIIKGANNEKGGNRNIVSQK